MSKFFPKAYLLRTRNPADAPYCYPEIKKPRIKLCMLLYTRELGLVIGTERQLAIIEYANFLMWLPAGFRKMEDLLIRI
jgi:hypothetical protein